MTEESVFYRRLKTEIQLMGKNFNQVERELGYPRNSLNNYKNSIEPSGKRLVELADYFGVSSGYLIGKTEKVESNSLKVSFQSLDFEQKRELYEICQSWATNQLSKRIENNNK